MWSLFVRGLIWFGAYLALILAPAAVALVADPIQADRPGAVEFSAGLGLMAFALVMGQFALVSRLGAASRPFGTDALVLFHQYIGFACLGLVLLHPLVLTTTGMAWSAWNPFAGSRSTQSGAIAVWALVALVATTAFRRRLRLSYESWQALHLALSVMAAIAMTIHATAVDGYTRAPAVRYVLTGYAVAFGVLAVNYRIVRPLRLRSRPWEITANRDEGAGTRTLRLRPVGHAGLRFDPGQFAWLIVGSSPLWSQQHPFSISSSSEAPPSEGIEFSIKALGDWSSRVVPALPLGARVWVDGPFGAFTTERSAGQGFVMLAGGIGIAPMRSMLLSMRDRGDRRHVVLFYAAHDPTRLIYRDELRELQASLALEVIEVFEAPADQEDAERGFITADLLKRRLPAQYRRYHFFVCGPPPMMDAVEAALRSLGVPAASIESERFNLV